jgi:hypothetical protein
MLLAGRSFQHRYEMPFDDTDGKVLEARLAWLIITDSLIQADIRFLVHIVDIGTREEILLGLNAG